MYRIGDYDPIIRDHPNSPDFDDRAELEILDAIEECKKQPSCLQESLADFFCSGQGDEIGQAIIDGDAILLLRLMKAAAMNDERLRPIAEEMIAEWCDVEDPFHGQFMTDEMLDIEEAE